MTPRQIVATDELRQSMTDTTSKEAILRLAKAISDDLYVAIANSEVFVPSGRTRRSSSA
jgi:hypothetical protein